MRRSLLSSFYYWQSNRSCSCDPMLGVWISQHTPSIGSQEEQLLHYTPNKGSTKPFKYIHTIPRLHQKTTTTLWSQLSQMLWKYLWRFWLWLIVFCFWFWLSKCWGTGKQVYFFIIKLLWLYSVHEKEQGCWLIICPVKKHLTVFSLPGPNSII